VAGAVLRVRPATDADGPKIHALARRFATSFVVSESHFLTSFDTVLSSHGARLLVAEEGGRILGYLLGFTHPAFYANGRVGWIEEVMVEETARRRRIGASLVAAFEDWARSRGARLVALATRRADPFYLALGYAASAAYFQKVL
jgi:GNAT superfamily N-acetyltransferase